MTKKILRFFEILGGIAAGMLFLTVLWQVIARVIFKVSSTWTVEIGRALFVIMVFCGSPILLYRDGHMAIKTFIEKLNGPKLKILQLVIDIIVSITLIALAYGCYNRTVATWNDIIPTVEWLTSGKIYLVMLIGTIMMLYVEIVRFKEHIAVLMNKNKGDSK